MSAVASWTAPLVCPIRRAKALAKADALQTDERGFLQHGEHLTLRYANNDRGHRGHEHNERDQNG